MKILYTGLVTLILSLTPFSISAHGDEDHSADAKTAPTVAMAPMAPRAIAQTEDFELVAVLTDQTLMITLDRFATNEPIANAKIEIDSGALHAVAEQIAPGLYSIPGTHFSRPGNYPLSISVETVDTADLLVATLDLAAPAEHITPSGTSSTRLIGGAAGAFLLAAGFIAWRRKQTRNHP